MNWPSIPTTVRDRRGPAHNQSDIEADPQSAEDPLALISPHNGLGEALPESDANLFRNTNLSTHKPPPTCSHVASGLILGPSRGSFASPVAIIGVSG